MVWTPPRTWPAGEEPDSATLNLHIRDQFKAIGDPWTAYTPVLAATTTAPTYTATGGYILAGGFCTGWFEVTITTPGSGNYTVTLPAAAAAHWFPKPFGMVTCYDQSAAGFYARQLICTGSTTVAPMAGESAARVGALVPFTFASPDVIGGTFLYEAA